jgi:hypothetical protein
MLAVGEMTLEECARVKDQLKMRMKRIVMDSVKRHKEGASIAIVAATSEVAAEVGVALLDPDLTVKLLRRMADDIEARLIPGEDASVRH